MASTVNNYKQNFLLSEQAVEIKKELQAMLGNPMYNTRAAYTPTLEDGFPFVDKHMKYLSEHPKLNPKDYLANLKLMTKVRR